MGVGGDAGAAAGPVGDSNNEGVERLDGKRIGQAGSYRDWRCGSHIRTEACRFLRAAGEMRDKDDEGAALGPAREDACILRESLKSVRELKDQTTIQQPLPESPPTGKGGAHCRVRLPLARSVAHVQGIANDLLYFVQLLVNQHRQEREQEHSGANAEHPHRKSQFVDFR